MHRLFRGLVAAALSLFALAQTAKAQTFTQISWGIARSVTPNTICFLSGPTCIAQIGSFNVSTGNFNPFNVSSLELVGGKSGGTFDNASIISGLSPGSYTMCLGDYRVASSITVPRGVILAICPGSHITPDVATVTLFRGAVNPNVFKQIFNGGGSVQGLKFNRPEWWGACGSFASGCDDAPAINAAITSGQASWSGGGVPSDGDGPVVALPDRYYACSQLNLTPIDRVAVSLIGSASSTNGGRIETCATFTDNALIAIHGNADPNSSAFFYIKNLQLVNSSSNLGLQGISLNPEGFGFVLNGGSNFMMFQNLTINGFAIGWQEYNSRRYKIENVTANGALTNSTGFKLVSNDGLEHGDSEFVNTTTVPCTAGNSASCTNTVGIDMLADGAGSGFGGIRISNIYGGSNEQLRATITNGAHLNDLWELPGSQHDGQFCHAVNITATGAGSNLNNIHSTDVYHTALQSGCSAADTISATGGATLSGVFWTSPWYSGMTGPAIDITAAAPSGSSSSDVQISGPNITFGASGSPAIRLRAGAGFGVHNVQVQGGTSGANQFASILQLDSGVDYVDADGLGGTNYGVEIVDNSGGTHNTLKGSRKFFYAPIFSSLGTGLLKGNGSTAISIAVPGTDYVAGLANPTASVGLTAVNGSAATAMRSDAAPALSQSIVPTWTGIHTFSLAPVFSAGAKYSGATSGTVTVQASAIAGTPTITWGNASGTPAVTASAPLALSTTTGNITVTGAVGQVLAGSTPAFTATPTLGVAGSAIGTLAFAGNTSGTATITPQATAGSPTLTLPNASGTLAVSATSPVAVSATTGNVTCTTCATTTNGGALSGTSPVALSAAGAISITGAAGQVLAGSGPAFTPTPTLGVAGSTVGSIALANATSGTITLQPVTGALGSAVLGLPAATDTIIGKATTDTLTNKTYDTAGTGNSFSINGLAATANTGTGAVVRATSPALTTPNLGTPSAATLTNATGLPAATGIANGALPSGVTVNNGNWSGTALAIGNGGTGQTTKAPAFDALQPMTTAGDIIYGGTAGTGTRLAAGTSSQVLTGGTTPGWGSVPAAAMPALTGDCTTSAGAVATTCTKINGVDLTAAPTTYTPTITCGSGSAPSLTGSATGRYWKVGRMVFVQVSATINVNGTCATDFRFSTPVAVEAFNYFFVGEDLANSKMLLGRGFASSSVLVFTNYDGTYPGADGHTITGSGWFASTS